MEGLLYQIIFFLAAIGLTVAAFVYLFSPRHAKEVLKRVGAPVGALLLLAAIISDLIQEGHGATAAIFVVALIGVGLLVYGIRRPRPQQRIVQALPEHVNSAMDGLMARLEERLDRISPPLPPSSPPPRAHVEPERRMDRDLTSVIEKLEHDFDAKKAAIEKLKISDGQKEELVGKLENELIDKLSREIDE